MGRLCQGDSRLQAIPWRGSPLDQPHVWRNALLPDQSRILWRYPNLLIKIVTLGLPHPINALFMGMLGMYVFLLSLRVRTEIAIMGAWVFAFNTFNLISIEAGHNA